MRDYGLLRLCLARTKQGRFCIVACFVRFASPQGRGSKAQDM
ncbi:hypothetical protein [Helicobacter sp.]|nr:hypothetical protein [Helicobacter sp.]